MKLPDDPYVRELLPEFVDTWIEDLDSQFDSIVASGNSDDLYRFGHTLKGSCLQFGLEDVAEKGIYLMKLAKENRWNDAKELKPLIKQSFIEMKEILAQS